MKKKQKKKPHSEIKQLLLLNVDLPICDRDLLQVCVSFTHQTFTCCSPATVGCSGTSSCTSGVRSLRGAAPVTE